MKQSIAHDKTNASTPLGAGNNLQRRIGRAVQNAYYGRYESLNDLQLEQLQQFDDAVKSALDNLYMHLEMEDEDDVDSRGDILEAIGNLNDYRRKVMAESKANETGQQGLVYEVQRTENRDCLWIHASDGSTVGRFGRMGVDIHNTVSEQMTGASQCRLCTHGQVGPEEWQLFKEKSLEFWGVELNDDDIDLEIFKSKSRVGS